MSSREFISCLFPTLNVPQFKLPSKRTSSLLVSKTVSLCSSDWSVNRQPFKPSLISGLEQFFFDTACDFCPFFEEDTFGEVYSQSKFQVKTVQKRLLSGSDSVLFSHNSIKHIQIDQMDFSAQNDFFSF